MGVSWLAPELSLGHKLARLPRELQGTFADKSMPPAFQQVLNDRWKGFREAIKTNPKMVAQAKAQVVGFLDSAVLNALADKVPDLDLRSTALAAVDDVSASAGVPATWLNSLPENLRNYSAVIWDKEVGELLVVPQDSLGAKPVAVSLRPNSRTKYGQALTVQGIDRHAAGDLRNSQRYEVLVGIAP